MPAELAPGDAAADALAPLVPAADDEAFGVVPPVPPAALVPPEGVEDVAVVATPPAVGAGVVGAAGVAAVATVTVAVLTVGCGCAVESVGAR